MNEFERQLASEKAGKTLEEIQTHAKEANIDLNIEQLDRVAGGARNRPHQDLPQVSICPRCGSNDMEYFKEDYLWYAMHNRCKACGWSDV